MLESDLDNIRNSCDVFYLNLPLSFLSFIWISSLFQIQGLLIIDFLSPCPSMVAKSVKVFSTWSTKTQCLRFYFAFPRICILYFVATEESICGPTLSPQVTTQSLSTPTGWISPPPPYLHLPPTTTR